MVRRVSATPERGRSYELWLIAGRTAPRSLGLIGGEEFTQRAIPANFDLDDLARVSEGFNGAEIEEAVITALFDAFSSQQELKTEFIKGAIADTVPLSKTMSEELNRLRTWANGRSRPASGTLTQLVDEGRRKIEI